MNKFKRLIKQKEFPIFLFILSFGLFLWPLLNINNGYLAAAYLYTIWGFIILILFFRSRQSDDVPEQKQKPKNEADHV